MILYDESIKISLFDYGIEIPVFDTRASKTFEHLKSQSVLGYKIGNWHVPSANETVTKQDLLRSHAKTYINRLYSDRLETEIIQTYELIDENGNFYRYDPSKSKLPLTQLFDQILSKIACSIACGRTALKHGFCFSFAGGMHHAQYDHGKGFCLLNDIVIAIRKLQDEKTINTAWVIDVDAHKGDGTAAITYSDRSIVTLSIHMANGWPLNEEKYDQNGLLNPSFISSDIDIEIDVGEEALYLDRLGNGLTSLGSYPKPEIAYVICGSDPYEKDELPSTQDIRLSLDQLMQRDLLVYHFLKKQDIAAAYLMAGGYGEYSWQVYLQFLEYALLDRHGKI